MDTEHTDSEHTDSGHLDSGHTDFEQMWRDVLPIGRLAGGGYDRRAFGVAERELDAWFVEQCAVRGLALETDGFGNRIGWWRPVSAQPDRPGLVSGSHLDSVLGGGGFDGALGVVSALAALDVLRERGMQPDRPIGVAVFVANEGFRFEFECLGSRLAFGQLDRAQASGLRDQTGACLADVVAAAGQDPERGARLSPIGQFVELHLDQGRGLAEREAAVAMGSGIRPYRRYRLDFAGEANHAGTTSMNDRHEVMLTYAMTALAANKAARAAEARATFTRVETGPGNIDSIPAALRAWLDVRGATEAVLDHLIAEIQRLAADRARRDGTTLTVSLESRTEAVGFDHDLATRFGTSADGTRLPVLVAQAGHDAGVVQQAGVPAAMVWVRNPSGVSHAPGEVAEMADCLAGVAALADGMERLVTA